MSTEILTGKPPFCNTSSELAVMVAKINSKKPDPKEYPELDGSEPIWELLSRCWNSDPSLRPTMSEVRQMVSVS